MPVRNLTGNKIRQEFIDYFVQRGHTFVPSSSLVPGGDQTLLFTNAGMVQFKEVFLGTDKRAYKRAVDSQKCMRVAGKHNDLDEVGRDDTHHTFFEMLGNWSFGDYYKKEAIEWAWDLLTNLWELPKENLWATCFEDELGQIERDDEAANYWYKQPGFDPSHLLFFGRKDNFWEMAETGPCGPNSEIHLDLGPEHCNLRHIPEHKCGVNQDCTRYLELWNLVFIQYNRTSPTILEPLPSKHVDTGMGFERIVSVLQGVDSNYKTDLLSPLLDKIQNLIGHNQQERIDNITSYRVIADHARAAAFLMADGVIPGNNGRNYICRMVIRRAARFGNLIGLKDPFLAEVAKIVIENYNHFYPELKRHQSAILDNLTREEIRFQRTLESGLTKLEVILDRMHNANETVLPGDQAFDLYATYGLPLEITQDIIRDQGMEVDVSGFKQELEQHRLISGAGDTFLASDDEEVAFYCMLLAELQEQSKLGPEGVLYNPYTSYEVSGPILAIVHNGKTVQTAQPGEQVEVILPESCFYVAAGGQVSDTGWICPFSSQNGEWQIEVKDNRRPISGLVTHIGQVVRGTPQVGDNAIAQVDVERRWDIMRNHTATHLLHAELRSVLGEHARQAGSLVAPDRLRFDFSHPEALTPEQLTRIEAGVNKRIRDGELLKIAHKPLQQAMAEGAMALFGEKYTESVRTISIGEEQLFSYELCGGTHVKNTSEVGIFLITGESSSTAGIRRIEAVTGREAYSLIQQRFNILNDLSKHLETSPEQVVQKARNLLDELNSARKKVASVRKNLVIAEFNRILDNPPLPELEEKTIPNTPFWSLKGIPVLTTTLPGADIELLRQLADHFRSRYPTGVAVLAAVSDDRPVVIAAISEDLVKRGFNAVELVKVIAQPIGGSGGGRPSLAQAGGRDASQLTHALAMTKGWIVNQLKV